jgi:hypothetical protein
VDPVSVYGDRESKPGTPEPPLQEWLRNAETDS